MAPPHLSAVATHRTKISRMHATHDYHAVDNDRKAVTLLSSNFLRRMSSCLDPILQS
jgi:hypothetical protein